MCKLTIKKIRYNRFRNRKKGKKGEEYDHMKTIHIASHIQNPVSGKVVCFKRIFTSYSHRLLVINYSA